MLRGIGGEEVFHRRYVEESQRVRAAGVEVARLQSLLDALQIFLPGLFVVIVVWIGARFAVEGTISPGELVAFYGYSAFLMIPLRTGTEVVNKLIRGLVAARRICRVLSVRAGGRGHRGPKSARPTSRAGRRPVRAARAAGSADRGRRRSARGLGGDRRPARPLRRGPALLGGVSLSDLERTSSGGRSWSATATRTLFSGPLRDELDSRGDASEDDLLSGNRTPPRPRTCSRRSTDGLDTEVEERGRSFSGGQRQRLVLTRALVAEPDILVLVEPTSAVDAHTEARIAERLRRHRAGRTTVVTTASPLMLDQADEVAPARGGPGRRHRHDTET